VNDDATRRQTYSIDCSNRIMTVDQDQGRSANRDREERRRNPQDRL